MGAHAFTAAEIEVRVAEFAPLRSDSLGQYDPAIPPHAYATVAKGDVATGLTSVEGQRARIAWGVGVVDAPIATVFSAVNDDRNKAEYSKLSHVQVLEGEYCASRRLTFQYLPTPFFVADRWWVVEQRRNTALAARSNGAVRELVWVKLEDGSPHLDKAATEMTAQAVQAAANDGGWWLVSLDDTHTLVEFWALSDPGGSLPAGLVSQFAAGSIRDTFVKIGTLARKGPSCSL